MDRFTGLDKWIVKSNVLVFLAKSWNVSIHGSSSTFIDDQNGVQIRYTQKINGTSSSKKICNFKPKKLLQIKKKLLQTRKNALKVEIILLG